MKINALMMNEIDNVVTCVENVAAGETVYYRKGEKTCSVTAKEEIPYCHKIALVDFAEGDQVFKYGELLGKTTKPVLKGHWVSHENISSIPRDYDSELIK